MRIKFVPHLLLKVTTDHWAILCHLQLRVHNKTRQVPWWGRGAIIKLSLIIALHSGLHSDAPVMG